MHHNIYRYMIQHKLDRLKWKNCIRKEMIGANIAPIGLFKIELNCYGLAFNAPQTVDNFCVGSTFSGLPAS